VPQSHQNEAGNPRWVWAKTPIGPGFIKLIIHPLTFQKMVDFGSKAKIGEFWGLVHGNCGPMPEGFEPVHTDGLKLPASIFRGLKRPLHHITGHAGNQVIIYVTNP
jgi:hypothetical protein